MAMAPRDGAEGAVVDLWAMASELERQFAGYKKRFPDRRSGYMDDDDAAEDIDPGAVVDGDARLDGDGMTSGHVEEDDAGDGADGGGGVRGRMYEAYTRRRDERLRSMWRARMERKEAEVMALWAQLRGSGTAAGADDDGCAAGEDADEDGEKRRSSDVAAPGRVSGKKHARTRRSFSSASLVNGSRPDVGLRRALSQEPLPPEPPTGAGRTHGHRARAVNGAAPKRKGLAKETGSLRQAGTKPPRGGLPRGSSSGGMEAVVLPNASVPASASQSRSSEQAVASDRDDEAPRTSPPRPCVGTGNGATGAGTRRAASPESECGSEVLNGETADGGEAEGKNPVVDVERREADEIAVDSPEGEAKLGNGEITSDSETEPSYVFINKKHEKPMRLSDALAASDFGPHLEVKNGTGNADVEARTADADTAAQIATTENVDSSNEMSSFSGTGRSGRGSAPSSPPSCSSRAQSIERLLEEDAALVQKRRADRRAARGRSVQTVSTPGSAGRRTSAATRTTSSPRGNGMGFKKRFLSFGKKTRGTDGATVIECTSPASVPVSPFDYGGERRRCRTADGSTRSRLVDCSSNAAASDDTEHGYGASPHACSLQSLVADSPARSEMSEMVPREKSPKSHRSFFSFRSFNCGRG